MLYSLLQTDIEFRRLIPPLTQEEYDNLQSSILAEGCRDALVLWGDILIDGHNRHAICQEHGIPFKTVQMDFPDRDAVKLWILKNQLGRRNLTDVQRGRLALQMKDLIAAQAKRKQSEAGGAVRQKSDKPEIDTQKELADLADLSHDTIHKIDTVDTKAPEPVKEAMGTTISINKAYEATKAAEASPEFRQQLEDADAQSVKDVLAEGMKQIADASKRQSKIMNWWRKASVMKYSAEDMDIWFDGLSDDAIENQAAVINNTVKNIAKLQNEFTRACQERRRLTRIK